MNLNALKAAVQLAEQSGAQLHIPVKVIGEGPVVVKAEFVKGDVELFPNQVAAADAFVLTLGA